MYLIYLDVAGDKIWRNSWRNKILNERFKGGGIEERTGI